MVLKTDKKTKGIEKILKEYEKPKGTAINTKGMTWKTKGIDLNTKGMAWKNWWKWNGILKEWK